MRQGNPANKPLNKRILEGEESALDALLDGVLQGEEKAISILYDSTARLLSETQIERMKTRVDQAIQENNSYGYWLQGWMETKGLLRERDWEGVPFDYDYEEVENCLLKALGSENIDEHARNLFTNNSFNSIVLHEYGTLYSYLKDYYRGDAKYGMSIQARYHLDKAIELDNSFAMLGKLEFLKLHQDDSQIKELLQRATEKKNPFAAVLSVRYSNAMEPPPYQLRMFFQKGYKLLPKGENSLVLTFEEKEKQLQEAIEWTNNGYALTELALLYLKDGGQEYQEKGKSLLDQAVTLKNSSAMLHRAKMYGEIFNNHNDDFNNDEAVELLYENIKLGHQGMQDLPTWQESLKYLKNIAKNGHMKANYYILIFYLRDKSIQTKEQLDKVLGVPGLIEKKLERLSLEYDLAQKSKKISFNLCPVDKETTECLLGAVEKIKPNASTPVLNQEEFVDMVAKELRGDLRDFLIHRFSYSSFCSGEFGLNKIGPLTMRVRYHVMTTFMALTDSREYNETHIMVIGEEGIKASGSGIELGKAILDRLKFYIKRADSFFSPHFPIDQVIAHLHENDEKLLKLAFPFSDKSVEFFNQLDETRSLALCN